MKENSLLVESVLFDEALTLLNIRLYNIYIIFQVFVHENYSSSNQINDITLLKLTKKVDFNGKDNHLKPICLATKSLNLNAGSNCVATGWGKSKNGISFIII